MRNDENQTFNYKNPDFSMVPENSAVFVEIPPTDQFYFKHKIIHWLNKINENYNKDINFNNIIVDQYIISSDGVVLANYRIGKKRGCIQLKYTISEESVKLIKNEVSVTNGLYENNFKFPNSSHFFLVILVIDEHDEIKNYNVERLIDLKDSQNKISIRYSYDANGYKYKDLLVYFDYAINSDMGLFEMKNDGSEILGFDDFFNKNISSILEFSETFFLLLPQFTVNVINNIDTLSVFYKEMREIYKKDGLNVLEDSLTVVNMTTI